MKPYVVLAALLAASPTAHADTRADAQRKIDEAKLEGCQTLRRMLVANKSCPDQGALAGRVFCSAKTYPDMVALQHACADVMRGNADAARYPATHVDPQPAHCTIRRVAGQPVWIDVPIHHTLNADTWCKTSVRSVAEKWLADHAWCTAGRTTFPFTFSWGTAGSEVVFHHTGYCPIGRAR